MKIDKILENVTKTLSGIVTGARKDPKLAALDRGVLEVALMISALDGTIMPSEYAAFEELASKCRGYNAKVGRELLGRALGKAGLLMAMAQVGAYSEEERLATFVDLATDALPCGFESGTTSDVRRAFALWVSMGVSDGSFSSIERKAVEALRDSYANVLVERAKSEERAMEALSPSFRVAYGKSRRQAGTCLIEPDFLDKVEGICGLIGVASKREKAEAELSALILGAE